MDTCYIIDQIKENLFDERHVFERLKEIKQVNRSLEAQYTKQDIESASNSFCTIKQKILSQLEVSPLYFELFKEIEKFLAYQQKCIDMEEKIEKMKVENEAPQLASQQTQSKNIFIDQLNNISRHLNRSKKSISILDLYGNFLIYDKLAKDQFEHIYRNLEKDTFFERIIKESNQKIAAQYGQDLCQAIQQSEKQSIVLKYTIFSEKSRKKFNKELDVKSGKLQNVKDINNFMDLTSYEDIYFAYLQCLTSNIFLIDLQITYEQLLDLPQKEQLDINKKFLEDIQPRKQASFKAILLITRLSKTRQTLSIQSIKKNPLFQKFQVKTKRKVNKIINRALNKKSAKQEQSEDQNDEPYLISPITKRKSESYKKLQKKE